MPFTFKIADLFKNIRVKGAEKQAGSLSNGTKKWAVLFRNVIEKWAWHGYTDLSDYFSSPLWRLTARFEAHLGD